MAVDRLRAPPKRAGERLAGRPRQAVGLAEGRPRVGRAERGDEALGLPVQTFARRGDDDLVGLRVDREAHGPDRLAALHVRAAQAVHPVHDPALGREDDRVLEGGVPDALGVLGDDPARRVLAGEPGHLVEGRDGGDGHVRRRHGRGQAP